MRKSILTAAIVLLISACGKHEVEQKASISDIALMAPAPPPNKSLVAANQVNKDTEKKIVKEGEISFRVADVKETRKVIYASLLKLGGYISDETETNNADNDRKEYFIKARVPAKGFDTFLNNVSGTADAIDSKNIRIKDVTTQYIDIVAQLDNKKKLEARYLELLKRGTKISDLLEIENKLSEIRSDIETTQGQLNYLVKQVEFSSLDITFYSKQTVEDNGQGFGYKFKRSLADGWDTLTNLFFIIISAWPIWGITALVLYVLTKWRNNVRKRKAVQQ